MRQSINVYQFRDAFHAMGRSNQFSYEALGAIFEYLEECDPDTELDVIAVCCDFAESSIEDFINEYSIDTDGVDPDDIADTVQEFLMDQSGFVSLTPSGFVYLQF